jgi:hypothetical protein
MAWFVALLFYGASLSWNIGPVNAEYFNVRAHNLTSDNGAITGFSQIGSSAFTDNLTLYSNDLITKGPWRDTRSDASGSVTVAGIQASIDNVSAAGGGNVLIPPGTYSIAPATTLVGMYTGKAAFTMKSNVHIWGYGVTLKLADSQSTIASPQRLDIFRSVSAVTNISFHGITFDMNGANNKISPSAPTSYNSYSQSAIGFDGNNGRADNVLIEDCKFINNAGSNNIVMGSPVATGQTLGSGWTVRGCYFDNNGTDTNDHSSIYGWANYVRIESNTFTYPTLVVGNPGPDTAYEVHGSTQIFTKNIINNYSRMMYVASNNTSATEYIIISNNISYTSTRGVEFYRETAAEYPVRKVQISKNIFTMADDNTVTETLTAPVFLATGYSVTEVVVDGNKAYKSGTNLGTCFFYFTASTTAGQVDNSIIVSNNYASGFTFGIGVNTNATNGLGVFIAKGNTFKNLTPAGVFSASEIAGLAMNGINAAGPVNYLDLTNNTIIDDRAVKLTDYGMWLAGTITSLYVKGNSYVGMKTANTTDTATVTNRFGEYANIAFTPQWRCGTDNVTVGNGTVSGYWSMNEMLVDVTATLTVGSSTSFPGGNLNLVLPFTPSFNSPRYLGNYFIFDNSVSKFRTGTAITDTGSAYMGIDNGVYVENGTPITFGDADGITIHIRYTK